MNPRDRVLLCHGGPLDGREVRLRATSNELHVPDTTGTDGRIHVYRVEQNALGGWLEYRGREEAPSPVCEWPLGCDEPARRGVEGIDAFGAQSRHMYCEAHLADIISGRALRRTIESAQRLGLRTDVTDPAVVAANAALALHQLSCAHCAGVKTWILAEMKAGRVVTLEDRNRVGHYTVEHACVDGLALFEAVGRAMMSGGGRGSGEGEPEPRPQP